jgi:hypothetical protein
MLQINWSAMLQHSTQYFISFLSLVNDCEKLATSKGSLFNKCNTRRKAVFLPIPGNEDISFTACSNKVEG